MPTLRHISFAVLPGLLFAAVADAAPFEVGQRIVELNTNLSYGRLMTRTDSDADFIHSFVSLIGWKPGFYDDLSLGPLARLLTGDDRMHFPLASSSGDGDHQTYRYNDGGSWTITNLTFEDRDGLLHTGGSFHATLGQMNVTARHRSADDTRFDFFDGEFDPDTAAVLGLLGHRIFGQVYWYFDINHDDFGLDERNLTAFGGAFFAVPEPSVLAFVTVAGACVLSRRRRCTQ